MSNFSSKLTEPTEPTEGVQVIAVIMAFALVVVFPCVLIMVCIKGCDDVFDAARPERERIRAEEQERYEAEIFAEYGETLEDRRARWKQLGDEAEWRRLREAAELERLLDD